MAHPAVGDGPQRARGSPTRGEWDGGKGRRVVGQRACGYRRGGGAGAGGGTEEVDVPGNGYLAGARNCQMTRKLTMSTAQRMRGTRAARRSFPRAARACALGSWGASVDAREADTGPAATGVGPIRGAGKLVRLPVEGITVGGDLAEEGAKRLGTLGVAGAVHGGGKAEGGEDL